MNYEQVENYLLNYSTAEQAYDANGLIHLLKAILTNIDNNFNSVCYEQYASSLEPKDIVILKRLIQAYDDFPYEEG